MQGAKITGSCYTRQLTGKHSKKSFKNGRKLKEQIEKGIIIKKRMRLDEWADKWYKNFEGSVSDTTYEGYTYTLSLIKKLMGVKFLYSIKAIGIEKAIKQLIAEGYSSSQVSKAKAMYNQIFRKAEANGIIDKNPVQLTEKRYYDLLLW